MWDTGNDQWGIRSLGNRCSFYSSWEKEITAEKVSWDAEVGERHVKEWCAWKDDIVLLRHLKFPRCYKPKDFGEVVDVSLYTFGDGCNVGYGAACYIRQVDKDGNIAVSLAMGKSKVSPLKMITIPRLELTAATVAVKIGAMVSEQGGWREYGSGFYVVMYL